MREKRLIDIFQEQQEQKPFAFAYENLNAAFRFQPTQECPHIDLLPNSRRKRSLTFIRSQMHWISAAQQ